MFKKELVDVPNALIKVIIKMLSSDSNTQLCYRRYKTAQPTTSLDMEHLERSP